MLSGIEIRNAIADGHVVFNGLVRGNALLLTLGAELLPFAPPTIVEPLNRESVLRAYQPQRSGWITFDLPPLGAVLISAKEHLRLSGQLGGAIGTLSHAARLGLFGHFASPFVGPRFCGHLTLELMNASPHTLRLHPGLPVAKVVLFRTAGQDPKQGPNAIPFFYSSDLHAPIDLRSKIYEEFGDDEN